MAGVLLLESGSTTLLESGSNLLLEEGSTTYTILVDGIDIWTEPRVYAWTEPKAVS